MLRRPLARTAALIAATALLSAAASPTAAPPTDREMQILPASPRPGDTIRVSYAPPAGFFAGAETLILRARHRTAADRMYLAGVPLERRAIPMTVLRRSAKGTFTGAFVLPDSVAIMMLAVEDPAATQVENNDGRLWEVLAHTPDGRPTFDAVNQRASDMMGRSWTEGHASARRLVDLYPDRINSWTLLEFFERALLPDGAADSLRERHTPRIAALVQQAKARPALPEGEIGTIFFRAWTKAAYNRNATPQDSAEFNYWLERLRREYPRHEQLAQFHAGSFSREDWNNPREMMDSLERMYPRFAPLTGSGRTFMSVASQIATRLDDETYRRWAERSLGGAPDSALRMPSLLVNRPSTRAEGMAGLRAQLALPATAVLAARGLTETTAAFERRALDARRGVLVALGRALVQEGAHAAAIDTLRLASKGTWDLRLFRDLVSAYNGAGDTAAARAIRVRLAVDPRTPGDTAEAVAAEVRGAAGEEAWLRESAAARREMHALLLERALSREIRGSPQVADANGRSHALGHVTGGQPAVVMFWSRSCGAAIEALPAITVAANRLAGAGTPVVFVVDEPPSEDLRAYLAQRGWTLPVWHDDAGQMRDAFANFGTPAYYVLDQSGRVRFDRADGELELLAQVDALRAESAR